MSTVTTKKAPTQGSARGSARIERAVHDRRLLVATADAMYNSKGIQFVAMDDLREATGLSLRAIYNLFPSKTTLILAVLDHRHHTFTEGFTSRLRNEPDPQQKLLAVYDYLAGWFDEGSFRGCGFINAFAEFGATEPSIAARVRSHKDSFQRVVARLVDEAGANPALAPQLAILAEGAQTTAAIAGNSDSAAHARAAAVVLIAAAVQR